MIRRERLRIGIRGHLRIIEYPSIEDYQSKQNATVLLDQHNDIHRENASILVSRALTDRDYHSFYYMFFGNGGAVVDPVGNLTFNPPNTSGAADLYNPLFYIQIDDTAGAPSGNYMQVEHIRGESQSNVVIHALVEKSGPLPNNQSTPINTTEDIGINEIGLKTQDGLLITHIVFAPIAKKPNSVLNILYTVIVEVDSTDTFGGLTNSVFVSGVEATSAVGTFTVT